VRGTTQVTQVRAKWSELPAELATWEDYKALKQTFPHALAWGQAGSQEPGNVSTGSDAGGSNAAAWSAAQETKFEVFRPGVGPAQ
jgi:hypothetical protein